MVTTRTRATCPACGGTLSQEGGCAGLCHACLIQLALESPSLMAELGEDREEETQVYSDETFSPGQVLGKRYRIRSLLGRGGMGEVWRASDLKLRVDVALKALRPQLLEDSRALEALRQEVRTAREVVSPNVCRVFDLVELDGQELVSMEYIDGITLLDILRMRAPLELTEAREIASQFLAGLEAIHEAGLVHRDVKPENIMITRSGRVVLMDFGIAKGLAEGKAGTVSGTPAYMAPEQARGEALDARADVFSAGVVLAEMIAPGGLRTFEARQEIWRGVHHEPPRIADSPWAALLRKAVAGQKERRHSSAAALARALEEVMLRVAGAEDLEPYPGLASFTEDDAEYFFGRELEVEEMWRKLQRPHLLGLIGPSGAGKSSFLRAGLLPVIPTGWRAVVTTPGTRPLGALARALVPELAGDTAALQLLTTPDDVEALLEAVSRWRRQQDEALLIVDQFEELFTQNPPEVQ
ncbi:MAG: protein kinase, partial [Gemmatimonadetes bacterium]|nr:protein kinase [Gemmatimonadota bacterium]